MLTLGLPTGKEKVSRDALGCGGNASCALIREKEGALGWGLLLAESWPAAAGQLCPVPQGGLGFRPGHAGSGSSHVRRDASAAFKKHDSIFEHDFQLLNIGSATVLLMKSLGRHF